MKLHTLSIALLSVTMSLNLHAADTLTSAAKADQKQQLQHNSQREAGFKMTEKELSAMKAKLVAERDALQKQTDSLTQTFSQNEDKLARLEEQLRLESGSLGEVFGVVRQNAKELQSEIHQSVTKTDRNQFASVVDDIVAAKSLPSIKQLKGLWQAFEEQIKASGEAASTQIKFVDGQGKTEQVKAERIGAFGLVTDQGYVDWKGDKNEAQGFAKQPENGPTLSSLSALNQGGIVNMVVDPSRGVMIDQLALEPTTMERLQAGGVVGKIILGLLVIGIVIALVRGTSLALARQKIRAQLKNPQNPGNNPLGRVLGVYSKEQNRSVESLELRLLEAVVDEQSSLEKGLSMLKLLAALAPMLGLLGTVTGMIDTFQVITQFGNGDPKVMAGGISMALVTTVLGLVAAMPLLLAHNFLSSQAEHIRNILEKQGIGLVAAQAEKDQTVNHSAPVGNAA
ncbi:biopolymer transport protein ExbB [Vibrio xiamenensis]|uniref:Biopolymer transport protein ExbB n=1 Tax=Vibrio xiamenensis TaxID=861298 RepID=A0A1G8E1J1_9VIBR|nr:biopolymer transport protein ExbB [Vibrio xiamenensis]